MLSLLKAWVRSLLRELRAHKLRGADTRPPPRRVKHRKTDWEALWERGGLADSVGYSFWAVSLGTTASKYQWILALE